MRQEVPKGLSHVDVNCQAPQAVVRVLRCSLHAFFAKKKCSQTGQMFSMVFVAEMIRMMAKEKEQNVHPEVNDALLGMES